MIVKLWVNTTSKGGIKKVGISFGSIFLLFSNKSSQGHTRSTSSWGKPQPPEFNDSPAL